MDRPPEGGWPWLVVASGHDPHGAPWVLIRRRGGRLVRIHLHPARRSLWETLAAVGKVLQSLPERPPPGAY